MDLYFFLGGLFFGIGTLWNFGWCSNLRSGEFSVPMKGFEEMISLTSIVLLAVGRAHRKYAQTCLWTKQYKRSGIPVSPLTKENKRDRRWGYQLRRKTVFAGRLAWFSKQGSTGIGLDIGFGSWTVWEDPDFRRTKGFFNSGNKGPDLSRQSSSTVTTFRAEREARTGARVELKIIIYLSD